MKFPILNATRFVVLLAIALVTSCTRESFTGEQPPFPEGELVETSLVLSPSSVQVIGASLHTDGSPAAPQTRTLAEPGVLEKQVRDIWVFQFDSEGKRQLVVPQYYPVVMQEDDIEPVKMMLRAHANSHICVIANTNSDTWRNSRNGLSMDALAKDAFAFSSEQAVYGNGKENLPMAAQLQQTIVGGQENFLDITLVSLLAKVQFSYELQGEAVGKMHVTSVELHNIPSRAVIGNAWSVMPTPCPADEDFVDISSTYEKLASPAEGQTYVWYIPQNLQGTKTNTDPTQKNKLAPANAFYIRMFADSDNNGSSYLYTLYPGGNTTDDFNLKGNYSYNVHVTLKSDKMDDRMSAAPANCFVMKPNSYILFDPYTRTETGGGWKYTDYVDASDPDKSIDRVAVLWQTGDGTNFAIGNNKDGRLVYYDKEAKRVHVYSGNISGNAVIAGYNAKNVIVWSWHIWVNEYMPAQVANAQEYTTYRWDSEGIYTNERVPGPKLMMCNLGAIGTYDELTGQTPSIKPFGLYYQWGRKDPFPALGTEQYQDDDKHSYTYPNVVPVYGNDTSQGRLPMSTMEGEEGSFRTFQYDADKGTLAYTIQHPMDYITALPPGDLLDNKMDGTFLNGGSWYNNADGRVDYLWGGIPFEDASQKYGSIIANNGATQKSLFDPCPAGWMVPASDIFLGLTKTGLPSGENALEDCNAKPPVGATAIDDRGMQLYLTDWKKGPTSFFPISGARAYDGSFHTVILCGIYYTSSTSNRRYAYTLHIHNGFIGPNDGGGSGYTTVGGSVRCVRESQ